MLHESGSIPSNKQEGAPKSCRKGFWEFLLWLSGLRTQLVSMRMQVSSLASLSGLRIQRCCKLWFRSQMWLIFGVAVAVAQANGYSSSLTQSLGTSIMTWERLKKRQKDQKKFF